jgi:hypothetical protein
MAGIFLLFLLSSIADMVILSAAYGKITDVSPWLLIVGFPFLGAVVALAASLVGIAVQRIAGRLSSFSAALSGVVGLAALSELLLGHVPGALLSDAAIMLVGYFVTIQCLWRIPVLRRRADPTSVGGAFNSLCGTVTFFRERDVALETAVANRSEASWRWSQRGTVRPREWRGISIGAPSRRVAPSLAALTLCGRRMMSGWIGLALGALSLAGWLRLDAIQRLKLHGRVATATVSSWTCTPAAVSIIDQLRYRRSDAAEWSIARYVFVADDKKIEGRSLLSYGCPAVPPASIDYARHDPSVTNVSDAEEVGVLIVGLPILALVLVRFGVLRVREGVLAVRLLRTGRVVGAHAENLSLPGHPPAAVTSAEVNGKQMLVITPAPVVFGERQNLLVDSALRTVAWDLLPFIPLVDAQGALGVPSTREVLPRVLAPLVALFALVVPFIAW